MVGRSRERQDAAQKQVTNYKLKAGDQKVWWDILREDKILHRMYSCCECMYVRIVFTLSSIGSKYFKCMFE